MAFAEMKQNGISVLWRFVKDNKAGRWSKLFLVLALAYVVWPFDLIPDFAVVIGWLDDAAALLVAVTTFMAALRRYRIDHATPPPIANGQVIDTVGTEVS